MGFDRKARELPAVLSLLWIVSVPTLAAPNENEDREASAGFMRPAAILEAVATARRPLALATDSSGHRLLVAEPADLVPVAELDWHEAQIGALRYYPRAGARVNALDYARLGICDVQGQGCAWIDSPEGSRLRHPLFTPNGDALVFARLHTSGMEAHYVPLPEKLSESSAPLTSRVATPLSLRDLLGDPCRMEPSGDAMVCTVNAGDPSPEGPALTVSSPEIRDSTDPGSARAGSQRLGDLRSRVVRVDWQGRSEVLTEPGLWRGASLSPDNSSMLLEAIGTTAKRFQMRHTGPSGTRAVHPLASRAAVRHVGWRPDRPHSLIWVERQADGRDRVGTLDAPFDGRPRWLFRAPVRSTPEAKRPETVTRLLWSEADPTAGSMTLLVETHFSAQTETEHKPAGTGDMSRYAVRVGETSSKVAPGSDLPGSEAAPKPVPLARWPAAVAGGDPAVPLTRPGVLGEVALLGPGGGLWVRGTAPDASRPTPTLALQDLDSGRIRTLRSNPEGVFERPLTVTDEAGLLVVRESPGEPSNLFFYPDIDAQSPRPVTGWDPPIPELAAVEHVALQYERQPDGLPLTADLYLPPPSTRRGDQALPTLLWAYPRDYAQRAQAARDQRPASRSLRPDPLSPLLWTLRGYAVLEADMPIVGEANRPANDTWLSQLRANAEAAILAASGHGVDPKRLTVVGYSYGAHMAVSLLAHTDLFRAGIALSGAYNRTTTPLGFQQESRTLWQAEEIYRRMSPIFDADKIHEPLLLIHGRRDSRRATRPEESERLYEALHGLGRPVRLVLLEAEGHRPRGRESVLHLLWEMDRWLALHGTSGD